MTAPVWVTELADAFWRRGGDPGPFPRDLRRPVNALVTQGEASDQDVG